MFAYITNNELVPLMYT